MRQNTAEPEQEVKRLQRCISDLVSVLALPAVWNNSEPSRILETFPDALVKLLDLDFFYAQARVASHKAPIEVLQTAETDGVGDKRDEIRRDLHQLLREATPDDRPVVRRLMGGQEISILPLQLGIEGGLGLIVVGCQRLDFPQQTERLVMSVAANQLAIMLQQAQFLSEQRRVALELNERVAQRTAELAAVNHELERSEARYRVVVETASDAVVSMDERGVITFANAATKGIFGYEAAELIGKSLTVLMPEALRNLHGAGYKRYLETGERHLNWYGAEFTAMRADGEEFPVEVSFGEMTADGQRIFTGFIRDITEKKRAEASVHASEGNLRLIINTMPVLAWSAWPDGRVDFFNQRWLDYTGLSPTQAQDWGWAQAFHPDDMGRVTVYWQSMMDTGESGEIEARLRQFDGNYRWFIIRAEPLRDESGAIVKWYGTNTDIEDRKRAEEELRRKEAFLTKAQRLSATGSFSWCVETDEITFSEEARRIFGFEPDALVTFELIASRVHPEDLPLLVETTDAARRAGEGHDYEIRLLMPDGSLKYLHTTSNETRGLSGRREYIGAIQDVTPRRLAQESLNEARSELAHMSRITSLSAMTASIAWSARLKLCQLV